MPSGCATCGGMLVTRVVYAVALTRRACAQQRKRRSRSVSRLPMTDDANPATVPSRSDHPKSFPVKGLPLYLEIGWVIDRTHMCFVACHCKGEVMDGLGSDACMSA